MKLPTSLDAIERRLLVWVSLAIVLTVVLYPAEMGLLLSKTGGLVEGMVGNTYALAALFLVLFFLVLKWSDMRRVLAVEARWTSKPVTRLVGAFLIVAPLLVMSGAPNPVAFAAAGIVTAWYGASLLVNPSTWSFLLPYLLLFAGAVLSPYYILQAVGEPLAGLASLLSSSLLNAIGVSVSVAGNVFQLTSLAGGPISVEISPGCSSITSITVFLLLCGLIYFDLRMGLGRTLKLAVLGVVALTLLNALRIGLLVWAGYAYGSAALWGLHSWLGYAMFAGFFFAALALYLRSSRPMKPSLVSGAISGQQ